MTDHRRALLTLLMIAGALSATALSQDTKRAEPDITKEPTLYTVGYAHLDTQWRWGYPQSIREYIPATLHDNFKLIEKYPSYIFNFSGSRRYEMMREYFPADYAKLSAYIKEGRWFPCGSSVDEGDVNVPSAESLIRHVLYGNQFFRREFNKESVEFMLPDCFGFPACLPSVLAHCGLKGFSTQKLVWGSANGIPFNVGVWEGLDGASVVAALNCTAYVGEVSDDLSRSPAWLDRIRRNAAESGLQVDYRYYGTGDMGGAPTEKSVDWVEKSVGGTGPIRVISAESDRMFRTLTPEQIARMPRYKGDLLLTEHSAGSITSAAYMKRWNRANELLADAAERAAVFADWRGGSPYPRQRLYDAWVLTLGTQMHDILPGTSIPKAYEYSQNDEVIAMNIFSDVLEHSIASIATGLDTSGPGIPIIVYNPLSIDREDIVEATIGSIQPVPTSIRVTGPDGAVANAQIVGSDGARTKIAFLAKVPSAGLAVYHVEAAEAAKSALSVSETSLENEHYRLTIDANGDVSSIIDKAGGREVLRSPIRLAFQHERPMNWPSWNMDWSDRVRPPRAFVAGPASVRIVERGPARVAVEITREAEGSKFVQTVRLAVGGAGKRIEFSNIIDWQSRECSLKATFPLVAANPLATYNWEVGTIQRGNNDPKKYEVPARQWFDLTDEKGEFGATVLAGPKYGSDKPDDNTLRLTLIYTPGTRGSYQDQGWQDWGRHEIVFGLAPHARDWRAAQTDWQAYRMEQPPIAFTTSAHAGPLGKSLSIIRTSDARVRAYAVKKAEEGNEYIIRLVELDGAARTGVRVWFQSPFAAAREIDGQERTIGAAKIVDGAIETDIGAYRLKSFAVQLPAPGTRLAASRSIPIPLSYDMSVTSSDGKASASGIDAERRTIPAEMLPEEIAYRGARFKLAPKGDGQPDAVRCKGQTILIPAGGVDRVYLLAAADGDREVTIDVDGQQRRLTVHDWTGYIGLWDTRIWSGKVPEQAFDWPNSLIGIAPGFIKRSPVAWFATHRHSAKGENEPYMFSYLFAYAIDVPRGAKAIGLPNDDHVFVLAASAMSDPTSDTVAAQPLFDELDRVDIGAPTFSPATATNSYSDTIAVSIHAPLFGRQDQIRYTLDGSEPNAQSPGYSGPFLLSRPTTVKARLIGASGPIGAPGAAKYDVNDTTSPAVIRATASTISTDIQIEFSELVDPATATNPANYRLENNLAVKQADISADGRSVVLTLASIPDGVTQPALFVTAVEDRSPGRNAMKPTKAPMVWVYPIVTVASANFDGSGADAVELKLPEGAPIGADAAWSLNVWVYSETPLAPYTIIAGFGTGEDRGGTQRFIANFPKGLHFWGSGIDVNTGVAIEPGKWQMLTVTYDRQTMRIYKDAVELRAAEVKFNNAEGIAKLAPPRPWPNGNLFKGQIAKFTIWSQSLSASAVKALLAAGPMDE